MWRPLVLLVLLAPLAACGHPAHRAPPGSRWQPGAKPPLTFIVGRRDAIVEVDSEGALVRTIAKIPGTYLARGPRALLVAVDDGVLRVVEGTGVIRRSVQLPAKVTCTGERSQSLFPQGGIGVSDDGRMASMILAEMDYDAAINLSVSVCLDTGTVHVDPSSLRGECRIEGDVSLISWPAPCEPPPAPSHSPAADGLAATASFPFQLDDGWIVRRDRAGAQRIVGPLFGTDQGVRVRSISPSGRWAVVYGPEFTASSFYNYVGLLDRTTGDVWPLPTDASKPLPSRLPMDQLRAEPGHDRPGGWFSYTDSTHWYDADGDLLRAGSLLIRPGVRAIDLGGNAVD